VKNWRWRRSNAKGLRLTRLACTATALLFAGSVAAQDDAAALAGHRVRLNVSGMKQPLIGNVVAIGDQHLSVQAEASAERTEVRWADVKLLQVSRGKKGNTLKGLLGGAAGRPG